MKEQETISQLQNRIGELEKSLSAKEKICRVLTRRVERSLDFAGEAYAIFERNILLQTLVDRRTEELEEINKILTREILDRAQSEQRLQSVIQGSPIPTFVIGKDHRVMYWNKALEVLTGVRAEEMIGASNHWRAFYGEERPCMADLLVDDAIGDLSEWYGDKYVKSGLIEEAYEVTDFFPALSDGGKWLHFTVAVMKDSHGNRAGAITSLENITARVEAENRRKESEGLYRTFIDSTTDMVFLKDDCYRHLIANKALCTFFGRAESEIIGRSDFELMPEEPANRCRETDAASLTMKSVTVSEEAMGGRFYESLKFPVQMAGGKRGVGGFIRDVTDRRVAGEASRMAEEKYRSIFENANDGIYQSTSEGKFITVNPSLARITGYGSPEEMIGSIVDIENEFYVRPDDRRKFIEIMGKEGVVTGYETELCGKDGKTVWVVENSHAVRNTEGKVLYYEGSIEDITGRKRLESQLLQAQKMEAIGTLAGGIAHDFNNLLMGILGHASLISLGLEARHPFSDRLKGIEDLVQSGAQLTRQLLGFARGGRYELKTTDFNEVIEKIATMFGRTKKEIVIHTKNEADLWTVEADRGQLEQILMNLFVNAWQAMPGGGDLYLETKNILLDDKYTQPHLLPSGRYVKLSVTDTGVGMDEKTRERIFEPFFTTREMRRGTGLGLATVYGIVRGHRGIINVYSEKGHGTTFNLYLPVSDKKIIREQDVSEELHRGQETILIIDDEEMIIGVTKDMLESLGYRIFTARSGRQAIDIYKTRGEEIDLVILDMIMPGLNGEETFERLREIDPDVKVILSSGYSLNGRGAGMMEKGCRAFIQKPFMMQDLSGKVRDVLDK